MKHKKFIYKIIMIPLFSIAIVATSLWLYFHKETEKPTVSIPHMTVEIANTEQNFSASPFGPTSPYDVPFLKISTVSFARENNLLYINFKLGAKLPKSDLGFPSFDGDRLIGASFHVDIKQNYYDGLGRKNPTGADASIKVSFYGDSDQDNLGNKIIVDGNLVDGGPGFDYFTVSYPYDQLIFNPSGDNIVINVWGNAMSKAFPASASMFYLENAAMSVDKADPKQIGIKL